MIWTIFLKSGSFCDLQDNGTLTDEEIKKSPACTALWYVSVSKKSLLFKYHEVNSEKGGFGIIFPAHILILVLIEYLQRMI